jgi:hypothetical protein
VAQITQPAGQCGPQPIVVIDDEDSQLLHQFPTRSKLGREERANDPSDPQYDISQWSVSDNR